MSHGNAERLAAFYVVLLETHLETGNGYFIKNCSMHSPFVNFNTNYLILYNFKHDCNIGNIIIYSELNNSYHVLGTLIKGTLKNMFQYGSSYRNFL